MTPLLALCVFVYPGDAKDPAPNTTMKRTNLFAKVSGLIAPRSKSSPNTAQSVPAKVQSNTDQNPVVATLRNPSAITLTGQINQERSVNVPETAGSPANNATLSSPANPALPSTMNRPQDILAPIPVQTPANQVPSLSPIFPAPISESSSSLPAIKKPIFRESPIEPIWPQRFGEPIQTPLSPDANGVNEFPGHPACNVYGPQGYTGFFACRTCDQTLGLPDGSGHGASVRMYQTQHVAKGQADRFVIYLHEWHKNGKLLGPYGGRHLQRIADEWNEMPYSVVLEPALDREVNEERRAVIVQGLTELGIKKPEDRIIVGYTRAEGLHGSQGAEIFDRGIINSIDNNGDHNDHNRGNGGNSRNGGSGFGNSYGGGSGGFGSGFGRGW